jgi:cell fate regulator YaaT (PSP1 superfamily)
MNAADLGRRNSLRRGVDAGFVSNSAVGWCIMLPMVDSLIAQELGKPYPASVRIVGLKIRDRGEVKKFDAGDARLKIGDRAIVDLDGELSYGVVYVEPSVMPFSPPMRVIKAIIRSATREDIAAIDRYERMAADGMAACRQQAAALGLRMKLVEVFCSLQRRQMTFVYTADDRIDFRELVRLLARRFGGRIEMRQIGARDEASRLGGIDTCGLVLCCASFLTEVKPVTVKQARGLGLPVDDPKLLGVCGRLKCCLLFEAMEATTAVSKRPGLVNPSRLRPASS